jgi:hypothetical protein
MQNDASDTLARASSCFTYNNDGFELFLLPLLSLKLPLYFSSYRAGVFFQCYSTQIHKPYFSCNKDNKGKTFKSSRENKKMQKQKTIETLEKMKTHML